MNDRPLGALQTPEPIFRVPAVVLAVVGLLAVVHLGLFLAGENWQVLSLYLFAFIPARISGDAPYPSVAGSGVWSFVTYALLHGSWLHLISNSLWFTVFGTILARRLPVFRFLLLCVAGAAAGALAMLIMHWGQDVILIGASGSVSGLMAAAIPLMYAKGRTFGDIQSADLRHLMPLRPTEIITDRRALFFTLVWFGVTLVTGAAGGWAGNSFADGARIAWEAHVGGFIAGLAAFYLLDMKGDLRRP